MFQPNYYSSSASLISSDQCLKKGRQGVTYKEGTKAHSVITEPLGRKMTNQTDSEFILIEHKGWSLIFTNKEYKQQFNNNLIFENTTKGGRYH